MKTLSKYLVLFALLLITQMSLASPISGSFVPTYQYFKITYPSAVTSTFINSIKNFMVVGYASYGNGCTSLAITTSPKSSKGGNMILNLAIQAQATKSCSANLELPLSTDSKGNIETPNTSYNINITQCSSPSLTATVVGDPDSTSGYTISIQ